MSLPVVLELRGEAALIVGGGKVALRRAQTLLAAGWQVRVVAPQILPELSDLPLDTAQRPYTRHDLEGARLVVAATDDAELNDRVCAEAIGAGRLVNHAGDAGKGNLRFPAVSRKGGVQVAVSTAQGLPMLAAALAQRFGALLPGAEQVGQWQRSRDAALAQGGAARERALHALERDIHAHLWGTL